MKARSLGKTWLFRQSPALCTTENRKANANAHRTRFERRSPLPHPRYREDAEKAVVGLLLCLRAEIEGRAPPLFCQTVFGLSITSNLSGMARTRAGLSGRPTCRPGVICPGLSAPQGWPLAAMPAGLPVGTLRPCLTSGRRSAPRGKCRALFFTPWPKASR